MKKGRKRLFVALAASFVLLVTVPLMAAFAGEGDAAVSGSDVSRTDVNVVTTVSQSNLVARAVAAKMNQANLDNGPDMDADWCFWVWYELGFDDREFDMNNEGVQFNGRDESVSITVADYSNPNNTLLYWRDTQTGKIYHPGDTLTVKVADMSFFQNERYNEETGSLDYEWVLNSWTLKAIWETDILEIDAIGGLRLAEPELNPNPYRVGYWMDDGLNIYNWGREVEGTVKGTLDLKNNKFTLKQGYDKIQIPGDYVPEIAGDTFVEWNTATDGSGRGYQPGDYVTLSDIDASYQWVDLYAIFEKSTKRNVVRLQLSDWRISDDFGTELYVQFDDNGVIPSITFPAALTNSLNEFAGWRSYNSDQIYEAGKTYYNLKVDDISYKDEKGQMDTRYAYFEGAWKGDQLSIERTGGLYLEFEGGSRSLDIVVKGVYSISEEKWTFEGNPAITIPADSAPDNERGYTFLGWNTSEYGVGKMYQPGESVPFTEYPWIVLYATYESEHDFTVTETSSEVTNIITDAEPVVGLVLQNDVSIDEVKMVVGKVEETLEEEVLDAISEQVELKEIEGQPNIQMLDIKLVDSQNHGVSIETGKIKIVIAYPDIPNAKDYNYTIYHYKNGVAETVPVEKYEDGLVFFADSFSPYALVWSEEAPNEPDTPDTPDTPDIPDTPAVDESKFVARSKDGTKYTPDQIVIHGNTTALSAKEAASYIQTARTDAEKSVVYNIYITDNAGNLLTMLPGKTLTVSVALPKVDGQVAYELIHIANGQPESVKIAKIADGKAWFEADGFSPYVLTWHETKSTGSPSTGDNFSPVIFIVLLVVAAAAAGTVLVLRNKKSKIEEQANA